MIMPSWIVLDYWRYQHFFQMPVIPHAADTSLHFNDKKCWKVKLILSSREQNHFLFRWDFILNKNQPFLLQTFGQFNLVTQKAETNTKVIANHFTSKKFSNAILLREWNICKQNDYEPVSNVRRRQHTN